MFNHLVETCPDDHAVLRERLDELSSAGARIVSVVWQPQRSDTDQAAAFDAAAASSSSPNSRSSSRCASTTHWPKAFCPK